MTTEVFNLKQSDEYLPESASKELKASSKNSRFNVSLIFSPGSTIPPGIAHSLQSFLCIAQNCRMGLKMYE